MVAIGRRIGHGGAVLLSVGLFVSACAEQGSSSSPDGAAADGSGLDGGHDGATDAAGPDGATDAAGPDGATDAARQDGSADASGVDARSPDAAPQDAGPPAPKVVFVTSDTHTGELGGLEGADAICATRAAEAELEGTFRAWLSTTGVSAASRLTHAVVSYVRTDGVVVADDWADLTDGVIMNPINRTAAGDPVSGDVWTGTEVDGSSHTPTDCKGWTDIFDTGLCGNSGATDSDWTVRVIPSCGTPLRLYCIQQ